jgi:hypothetical protein
MRNAKGSGEIANLFKGAKASLAIGAPPMDYMDLNVAARMMFVLLSPSSRHVRLKHYSLSSTPNTTCTSTNVII